MPYSKYYKILNLPVGASKQDIKRAFRKKAMLTHPDRNPNPNAKAEFLAINTAYEILTGQRSLPKSAYPGANRPSKTPSHSSQSTKEKEREARRERMKAVKRKKEEAYRNSPQFKKDLATGIILDQMGYIMAALLLLAIPILLYANPAYGFVLGLIFLALSSPLWYKFIFTSEETINTKHFMLALKFVYLNTHFRYYLFGALNISAILVFILNTFVPFSLVILFMGLPTIYLLIKQEIQGEKHKTSAWFKATSLGPLLVNLFFVINFTFSHSTMDEFYKISRYYNQSSDFFMRFERDEYKAYPSVRFFMTFKDYHQPYVRLKTEKGLFGFKVLKQYEFVRYPMKISTHQ